MSDEEINKYARHFNKAITLIRTLPASERSAMSNRQLPPPNQEPRPERPDVVGLVDRRMDRWS